LDLLLALLSIFLLSFFGVFLLLFHHLGKLGVGHALVWLFLLSISKLEPVLILVAIDVVREHSHLLVGFLALGNSLIHESNVVLLLFFGDLQPTLPSISLVQALSHSAVGKYVHSFGVLLAVSPVTEESAAISMNIDTETILLVGFVATIVHSSILPLVGADAVHKVLLPLTVVESAVTPEVEAGAVDLIVMPLTKILVAIVPNVDTFALLLRLEIVSVVLAAISEEFVAHSVLEIVAPMADVLRAISTGVGSLAVGLIVLELTVIDIAIYAEIFSFAVSETILPEALIL
jgi:hypothetical protein